MRARRKASAIVIVIAALALDEGHGIRFDHAARLEGELAGRVGDGRRPAELRRLCGPSLDRLEPRLIELGLLLELGIARFELLHPRLQRVEAVEDRRRPSTPALRRHARHCIRRLSESIGVSLGWVVGHVFALLGEGGRGEREGRGARNKQDTHH